MFKSVILYCLLNINFILSFSSLTIMIQNNVKLDRLTYCETVTVSPKYCDDIGIGRIVHIVCIEQSLAWWLMSHGWQAGCLLAALTAYWLQLKPHKKYERKMQV